MNKYSTVDEFLHDLEHERRQQIQALQELIKIAHSDLTEHIKWNSPSYMLDGEDRITFNTHYPDRIMIILHMGATRKENKKAKPVMQDESGLISWKSDIRGILTFYDLDEINIKKDDTIRILKKWLNLK